MTEVCNRQWMDFRNDAFQIYTGFDAAISSRCCLLEFGRGFPIYSRD